MDARDLPLLDNWDPWYRVHRADFSPLYFGTTARNRFDAPNGEYGVCYLAHDPHGAFIETFGWSTGVRVVTSAALSKRGLARIQSTRPLRLIDLTGEGLARIGADERLCAGEHAQARRWALALWRHPTQPDGLLYRARHDPSRLCAAVYDRAQVAFRVTAMGNWLDPPNTELLLAILDHYGIGLIEERDYLP